jgi:hypothetical protein
MAATSKFNDAVAEWLRRKTGYAVNPDSIDFGTEWSGGCETCDYAYAAITYRRVTGQWEAYDMAYTTPGDFVAEVAAIVLEVNT